MHCMPFSAAHALFSLPLVLLHGDAAILAARCGTCLSTPQCMPASSTADALTWAKPDLLRYLSQ